MTTQGDPPEAGGGRARQMRRTHRALVAAAEEVWAEGRVPTVAEVAERADVSRATAYRYFPTQEALLLETTYLGDAGPLRSLPALAQTIADPVERLGEAVRVSAEWTLGAEARLRAVYRLALDPASGVTRPARRRGYIADLLAPERERLGEEAYGRLAAALTLLFGLDPVISLLDNGDVPREQIPDALAWTARAVVRAALDEAPVRRPRASGTARAGPGASRARRGGRRS